MAVLLLPLMGFIALAIDYGYLMVVLGQLQNSADAAALAAAGELMHPDRLKAEPDHATAFAAARATAVQYAALNPAANESPVVDPNDDVRIGYLSDPSDRSQELDFSDPDLFNTVEVRVQRTEVRNGPVSLFFARVLGIDSAPLEAVAAASFKIQASGFRSTEQTGNPGLLPFALDKYTWDLLLEGQGSDNWKWDEETQSVVPGSDGILEVNLYPDGDGSLPPGNRGTIDVGSSGNSSADIERQILHGPNEADLAPFGGELKLGEDGTLPLNGDTGISAGFKDALEAIIGQPRTIPIFSGVAGPGNTATYTIVGFVGIRIVAVNFSGSNKYVTIQPAIVLDDAAVFESGATSSQYIYGSLTLCR